MNNNDGKNLEFKEAIIKVIAFFDMFDYPLTLQEIWLNLSVKCELFEVIAALEKMAWKSPVPVYIKGGKVEHQNGFYFLSGRGAIIEERLKRYNFTDRKFKRTMFVARIFKFIPWIKMVAVGNLLGAHNLKDSSDIDFFIVAEDKRIWLTRFFCIGVTKFLGLRPQANNSRDKICLSFYVSDKALDLSGLMLKQKNLDSRLRGNDKEDDDIYFIYWLAGLTPLYDAASTYQELIKANQWLYASLPNWQPVDPARKRLIKPFTRQFYHEAVNLFIGGLEPQCKKFQLRLLPKQLKDLMNLDDKVVINDQIIKLHANDRREEYREKFFNKIKL
ncbi:MAG: hypothetical protein Q8O59_00495 [bacterium]|nr:hypothetical protein [bacterium]